MHGGKDEIEIAQTIEALLDLNDLPDAITTASDRITIQTFAYLRNKGIQIPTQIALGGFSNFSAPELFSPALTTVVQPAFEVGKKAMEMLLQLIENKRPAKQYQTTELSTQLIVRNSSLNNQGKE